MQGLEQQADRRSARAVGDNEQYLFVAIILCRTRLGHDVGDLFGGDIAAERGEL